MKRMLSTLRAALSKRGLTLHPSKCQVQTNVAQTLRRGEVTIEEGFSVEVLDEESNLALLGTVPSLIDVATYEIRNRIAEGWRMFWSMKPLLLNQKVSINRRLR